MVVEKIPKIYCFQWRIQDFPRGGGANSRGGAPTYDFVNFRQKLHENEEILAAGGGGGRVPCAPPLDPPLALFIKYKMWLSEWRIFEFLSGAIYQCDFVLPIATLGLFPVTKSIFFKSK